jgi:hypothetical protein
MDAIRSTQQIEVAGGRELEGAAMADNTSSGCSIDGIKSADAGALLCPCPAPAGGQGAPDLGVVAGISGCFVRQRRAESSRQ